MTQQQPDIVDVLALSKVVSDAYWNRVVATANDHDVRLGVMTGPFGWHLHPDSDEIFLVLDGTLIVATEAGEIRLEQGEMVTVPRGVRHRTSPGGARSVNLTVSRRGAETIFDQP